MVKTVLLEEKSSRNAAGRAFLCAFDQHMTNLEEKGMEFSSIVSKTWRENKKSNSLQERIGLKITQVIENDPAYPEIERTTIYRRGDYQTVMGNVRRISRITLSRQKIEPPPVLIQLEVPNTPPKKTIG